jgi:hypothetical protein
VERVEAIGPAFRSKYTEEASLGLVRRRHERRINDGSKSLWVYAQAVTAHGFPAATRVLVGARVFDLA